MKTLSTSKEKPLVSTRLLEAVLKRLGDSFATVIADTLTIILSPEYVTHFNDIYIHGKENAKITGDHLYADADSSIHGS